MHDKGCYCDLDVWGPVYVMVEHYFGSNAIVLRRGEMTSSGYKCSMYEDVVLAVN